MEKDKIKALIYIIFTGIVWGLAFVSTKILVSYMSTIVIAFSRYTISAVFLILVLIINNHKFEIEKCDIPRIFFTALLGYTGYFCLDSIALKTISASDAGIINGAIPIFTLVAEIIFFKKKSSKKSIFGFFMSMLGVYLIVAGLSWIGNSTKFNIGHIYMIGAVFCWIGYSFLTRDITMKYSSLPTVAYQTVFTSIMLFFVVLFKQNALKEITSIFTVNTVLMNLLFLAIICSAIGYYTYASAMEYLGVANTSIFMNLIPISSLLGGVFILGESITIAKIFGMVFIIISAYIVTIEESKTREKKEKYSLDNVLLPSKQ